MKLPGHFVVWTKIKTISLSSSWQYTEPVEGEFFRLRHAGAPGGGLFAIGQAEINADNTVNLVDVESLEQGRELDVVKLIKPGFFTARRIAIKKINSPPTLESEFRRLFKSTLFESRSGLVQRSNSPWNVVIESSDYVSENSGLTLEEVAEQFVAVNQKLLEIAAKIDNIDASGSSSSITSKNLAYVSDGDANGICYWIGTNYGQAVWQNPHAAGIITILSSSYYSAAYSYPESLVDRLPSDSLATQNASNSWIGIDLSSSNKLNCNCYSLRGRNNSAGQPRAWKLQGKNDGGPWEDLDTQENNSTINQNTWFTKPLSNSKYYRYFRIFNTGINTEGQAYLCLGEWEFYGTLQRQL